MDRHDLETLYGEVWASYREVVEAASPLSDTELDSRVPWGNREIIVRNALYLMVGHAREHTVHLNKVLQRTGAPGGQPTEAHLILGQIAESLGSLQSLLARMTDADLGRELEGHTVRTVLEHVAATQRNYAQRLRAFLHGPPTQAAS